MYGTTIILTIVAAILVFLVLLLGLGRARLASPCGPFSRFPLIERLVSFATAVAFIMLTISGFWYLLLGEPRMTGGALMAHVTAGGIFAGVILAFAILRTEACRFGVGSPGFHFAYKAAFWGLLLCSLVLIITAVVPMLPWLDTHGQESAVGLHRYAAAGSLFFGILMALLGLVRRK